jgi:hypothetical protein
MRIFAQDKAKNWIEGRIHSVLKDKKILSLTILIMLSGCFFYNQLNSFFPRCFGDDYKLEGKLPQEKESARANSAELPIDGQKELPKKVLASNNVLDINNPEKSKKNEVKNQIYQLVGNSPIKDMVPSIVKLDNRVAAFVIGIAKKESDWGKHAPSQSGKTCYNYWGYKGSGSRGTSMGYACFGTPEEAVDIVGRRIENLVSKNINEPRKMLVWKCGSSCAGHDPAGVQKWVSDVSLYYGKVIKIQNI